jgi:putative salt-induced outer membrane protein
MAAALALLATSGILASTAARADWTGKGEAGLLVSRGNADATTGNLKLDLAKQDGQWKNAFGIAALYGKNASFVTAQRIEGRYQLDHSITERLFWYGALHAEQDKFSGFNYQASLSSGVGYKFIDTEATKLTGTLGVGIRRLQPETLTKSAAGEVLSRVRGEATSGAVANAGIDFSHQLSKTTKILDKLLIESGSSNTSLQNDLALQVSMTDALALSVGYSLHNNTKPPPGAKKLDQLMTVNLVYQIK